MPVNDSEVQCGKLYESDITGCQFRVTEICPPRNPSVTDPTMRVVHYEVPERQNEPGQTLMGMFACNASLVVDNPS